MSLCGFGKSLDHRFRNDLLMKSAFTYMACGTVPVSWLKQKPFTNAKTYCGFWSIESVPDAVKPKEYQDTYGVGTPSLPICHEYNEPDGSSRLFRRNPFRIFASTPWFALMKISFRHPFDGRAQIHPPS
jgi:hypothetical protein